MAAGDKSAETFAGLYLSGGRGRPKRQTRPPIQSTLFGQSSDSAYAIAAADPSPAPDVHDLSVPLGQAASASRIGRVPLLQRRVWTVRELVGEIRQQVERVHFSVWVEGEISNCRPGSSGHLYFTLKDGDAQLPVVLFRRQAQLLPIKPKDGDAIEVRGRISIYESRGQLQLIAESLELRGVGALELAYKQLKARLLAEGLFAEERKRPLPAFPRCIGVITSPHGAVIRDIVNIVRRRRACLNLLVYPAAMQGPGCAREVGAGIRWFNAHREMVEVIVLARGGGSIEDLAGFNDEALARAIVVSALPVVSAIGHETDFTIADFVADLRAPTPSAAAELVTAAQHRVEDRVFALEGRVQRAAQYQMMCARQRYTRLSADQVLVRLHDAVSRRDQRCDELHLRLETAAHRRLRIPAQRLAQLTEGLRHHDASQRLTAAQVRLKRASEALIRLRSHLLATRKIHLEKATAHLHALSPLAVLSRGYALVYTHDGSLLRNATQAQPGSEITARLATGTLRAIVKEITG